MRRSEGMAALGTPAPEGTTDRCAACAGILPDDAIFCSACGTERRTTATSARTAQEIGLAAANLLRLRGQYEAAEARCVDVLRSDPDNVHAHSLLGDIYAEQGRIDDARQWYQIALDLDPRSRSDRDKLARLTRQGNVDSNSATKREDTLVGLSTSSWVRWLTATLAVCLISAVIAILMRHPDRRQTRWTPAATNNPSANVPVMDRSINKPGLTGRTADSSFDEWNQPAGAHNSEAATFAERAASMKRAIVDSQIPGVGSSIDPIVRLTAQDEAYLILYRTETDAQPDQQAVATTALHVIQVMLQADTDVQRVYVSVRSGHPDRPDQPVFEAWAIRETVVSDTARSGRDVLESFAGYRWTPYNAPSSESSEPDSMPR